jgi:4-hydroxy-3-methylbut-2-enyl diphosphate reductase
MKIVVAKDAGYCFGVRDAVNLAFKSAQEDGDVYMLGHIVHNENVVKDLEYAGVKVIKSLDEVPKGKPIMFRAHGTEPNIWDIAKEKGLRIVDATCPLVTEIHKEVNKLEQEGRTIIIIGDHDHDEVIGISKQVENAIIVSNPEEAEKLPKMKYAGVVSQSTQMIENVQAIINVLMMKVFDLNFVNTICFPTKRNHEQIKELAEMTDMMIIIGSFTSANSNRLTQLAQVRNKNSYQVTCADDLKIKWFEKIKSVGITAGASTPDDVIQAVINRVREIGNVFEEEVIYG